ncbi:MAG: cytochrome c [Capsulimonadaceae bacterium]
MAQDMKPTESTKPEGEATATEEDEDAPLHYYSGGEIKELPNTGVPPVLFWFNLALVVFLAGVGCWTVLYPMHDKTRLFRPPDASAAKLAEIQEQLDQQSLANTFQNADRLDISRIPLPPGQTLVQAVSAGSDVFDEYCKGCHGPNQDGNGVNAAGLNPKPRNLRDAPFMQAMSYQRISTSVHKGVPGTAMPRWENSLDETQIKDVIAYVLSLTSPTAPAITTNASPGGESQYTGQSEQNSPQPITPPINGNPAEHTITAPPSASGQPTAGTGTAH